MQHIAAIFDLDETLLDESSGRLLFHYLRRNGQLSRYFRLRDSWTIATAILAYRMGMRDVTQVMQRSARIARGIALDEFWQLVQCWFDEMVVDHITPLGQEQLTWHRAQGHLPVICSASSQFSVQPVAHHLGIEHMVYTEWLGQDGYMTGEILPADCIRRWQSLLDATMGCHSACFARPELLLYRPHLGSAAFRSGGPSHRRQP